MAQAGIVTSQRMNLGEVVISVALIVVVLRAEQRSRDCIQPIVVMGVLWDPLRVNNIIIIRQVDQH